MAGNMTKSVLRTHLISDTVDEELLQYICMNAHTVLYISLEQLCKEAGVDAERVQAFFQTFGVDDFIAFKYILRKCLYYEVSDRGTVRRSLNSLSDEVIRMEMQNLTALSSILDTEQIDRLAEDILNASQVTIICRAGYKSIADSLAHMLWLLDIPRTIMHEESIYDPVQIDEIPPSSLVIVFGRMRYSMRLLMEIKMLKQRGLRIVCFTDYPHSPFIPLSDYHFLLPTTSFDFTDSNVAGTVIVQVLALCLGMKREDVLYTKLHDRTIRTQENNMFW